METNKDAFFYSSDKERREEMITRIEAGEGSWREFVEHLCKVIDAQAELIEHNKKVYELQKAAMEAFNVLNQERRLCIEEMQDMIQKQQEMEKLLEESLKEKDERLVSLEAVYEKTASSNERLYASLEKSQELIDKLRMMYCWEAEGTGRQ